jgi:predicted acylesterase/phospholipase RssA
VHGTDVLSNGQNVAFDASAKPLRALALDGGGMRGHYTANQLDELCRRFSSSNRDGSSFDLHSRFDLMIGASTGAFIAAALAVGKSPMDVASLYHTWGERVFSSPVPDFDRMPPTYRNLRFLMFMKRFSRRPFNDDRSLREALESLLGTETFGTVWKRGVALLIPAVDMSTHNAWVFKTSHIAGKHRDEHAPLVEACLASSAAPYFFPLAHYSRPFADGGLFANSPMLLALIEAMEMTAHEPRRPIEIVSVGTCPPPVGDHATRQTRHWGFEQWQVVRGLTETLLDVQVSSHYYMTKFLLPHLNRKATIFRLYQSEPNNTEAAKLGLDRADREALDILERRARSDAARVHSEARDRAELAPIREIFTDVPINEVQS